MNQPPSNPEDAASKNNNQDQTGEHSRAPSSGPLSILFPVDLSVWGEARRLIADSNLRVDDLAICASQDPTLVIELLKSSNAMYFSAGRQPITSTRTAIVRLGSQMVLELFEKMKDRPQIEDQEISHWFEIHRSRCKRTSLVSRILAESIAKNLSDECQVIGHFVHIGELLAVMYLGERYLRIAQEVARGAINYRLSQDLKFDTEKMGLNYLRRNGIPEALVFAIDREGRSKAADKAIMKPVCLSAAEFVDAFDLNRWDKFAPGKVLPPKSAIRTLPINDSQYLKLYERISEYLFAVRVSDERKKQSATTSNLPGEVATSGSNSTGSQITQEILQSEIKSILNTAIEQDIEDELVSSEEEDKPAKTVQVSTAKSTPPKNREEEFSLNKDTNQTKPARTTTTKIIEPPKLVSKSGTAVVTSIASMINEAKSSEDLLKQILAMLVDNGPFHKSALIVLSQDRTRAIVVAARGPNIGNGQEIDITDPLSPLSQCFSKVQSFGNRENQASPFGSKAFALAPIDADHDTPVALYADCGNNGSITFEARRVFRTVVEILNEKLPQVPGGIPVELK